MKKLIQEFLSLNQFAGEFFYDEPIAPKTTFKVGGKASVYAEPADTESLCRLMKFIKQKQLKYFVLGGGSNIVFTDGIFEGIVVSTVKLNEISVIDSIDDVNDEKYGNEKNAAGNAVYVKCGCGASMTSFVNFCMDNGLWNAQEFAGLPGSAGGAVYMNARCFNKSISDIFKSAEYLNLETMCSEKLEYSEKDWEYKISPFQDGKKIVLNAVFALEKNKGTQEQLKAECKKYVAERVEKGHFKFPSAGSVFKNNHEFGKPSGKLIDEAGLKGIFKGKAQIAPWHGNFIINTGNATAEDIRELVSYIQDSVREKTGFLLGTEIIFVE